MGLKNFKADVAKAHQNAIAGLVPGVSAVKLGDSDGEVVIAFHHHDLASPLRIQAIIEGDVRDYPDATTFMFFTDADDPPSSVVEVLSGLGDSVIAISIPNMVTSLANSLGSVLNKTSDSSRELDGDKDMTDVNQEELDSEYDTDEYEDYEDYNGIDLFGLGNSRHSTRATFAMEHRKLPPRVKRDLRKVREAGYRVGIIDGMAIQSVYGIISISTRVANLHLSEEAMEAWDVKDNEYIVLLIRFQGPYKSLEQALLESVSGYDASFAIGKCDKYKPSLASALAAFSSVLADVDVQQTSTNAGSIARFHKVFVSNSLDQFMNEALISLLKLRNAHAVSWDVANEILISKTGLIDTEGPQSHDLTGELTATCEDDAEKGQDHEILAHDHLTDAAHEGNRSLPLIAMQFAMRYFIRCTEFCLRCHRKLPKDFEALRPYVCDNPLCLFQYMAMGFGPSIEHEILTEPYVVDLLVSLCYASIQPFYQNHNLGTVVAGPKVSHVPIRTFPVGLQLQVPSLVESSPSKKPIKVTVTKTHDSAVLKMVDPEEQFNDRLMPGTWIALRANPVSLTNPGSITHGIIVKAESHLRSLDVSIAGDFSSHWYASSTVGPAFASTYLDTQTGGAASIIAASEPTPSNTTSVYELFLYDVDFDSLTDDEKALAMRYVLDTLPGILKIEEYLASHPHRTIRSMREISPAAASLLQWIVSSNRSCIFQIDRSRSLTRPEPVNPLSSYEFDSEEHNLMPEPSQPMSGNPQIDDDDRPAGRGRDRENERIPGMEGWVQFKFAQGSPDKELRFKRALQEVVTRKKITTHPTIFAWHGSSLSNWHSIVRTGLDYRDIRSGRSFGHGVYFSPFQVTSMSYSASNAAPWQNSCLKFTCCMSLNEIINAPDEFVSNRPHYVVANNDWNQCRYLFIKTGTGSSVARAPALDQCSGQPMTPSSSSEGRRYHAQAPGWEIKDIENKVVKIPLAAVPLREVDNGLSSKDTSLRAKRSIRIRDGESEDEDSEDVACLLSDEETNQGEIEQPPKKLIKSRSASVETIVHVKTEDEPPATRSCAEVQLDLTKTDFRPGSLDFRTLPRLDEPSWATSSATRALGREVNTLQKIQATVPLHELGWYIDFDKIENLYQWVVEFHSFDKGLPLAKDMTNDGITSIVLEVRFPQSFPFDPPFVRVVRPRLLPFLEGGGGHVTAGGAVCMELLTTSGWSPACSMESVLLQVRIAMCSFEPQPARLASSGGRMRHGDYVIGEAIEAYMRAALSHRWKVPENLKQTANGV